MKQIEDNKICKYCLGCEQLAIQEFEGVIKCNYFMAGKSNWHEEFIKAIQKKK